MARLFTHANELLLRHLFETLDGAITGPQGFSGSIEKRLATCTQLPLTPFKVVRLTEDLSKAAFTLATFLRAIFHKNGSGKVAFTQWRF